jgi:hypothetical protein
MAIAAAGGNAQGIQDRSTPGFPDIVAGSCKGLLLGLLQQHNRTSVAASEQRHLGPQHPEAEAPAE